MSPRREAERIPEPVELRNPLELHAYVCRAAVRWEVAPTVMLKVVRAANLYSLATGGRVSIISGRRTPAEQEELRRQGRPTAPPELSTHLSCPATGVDIRITPPPTDEQRALWGGFAMHQGLRWGGGSRKDPETGIPSDWAHVDVGPRQG